MPKRNFFTSDDIVVRSSAGTSELLDISLCDDISEYYDTIKNNNIKIIILTSHISEEEVLTSLQAGASAYVQWVG